MEFGVDIGLVSSSSNTSTCTVFGSSLATSASDPETKQNSYGSGFFEQDRSLPTTCTEVYWRDLKVAKNNTDDFSLSKTMLRSNNTSLFSDGQQQMLSFSSPNLQPLPLPNSYHNSSTSSSRNTGYDSVGLNGANMHGILTGAKAPFTPSQWMELEHQALIYKYITGNSPVPSNLLNPIRKAIESAGFSSFPGNHLRPNTLGWGAFHLGFSNNTDPEPGRCRRTDGKKWRCSRDAVADQKYCERHVNRGRHRSRKPVEGQTGHPVPGATNTAASKFLPVSSSSIAASMVPASGTSNCLGLLHQTNNLQRSALNPSASPHLDRSFLNKACITEKVNDTTGLSMLSPTIGIKESQFLSHKQQNAYQECPRTEFGLVCSDSLLNPFQKSSSLINCRSYDSCKDLNGNQNKLQNPLRQFMDDWPKNQSEPSAISWPDLDMQVDRTQLSISIAVAPSDFMSTTSSPTSEKLALSPLRLSCELDSTQTGLGMNAVIEGANQRQSNWIPISWENSMGGPLGEVLHNTSNSSGDCKNTSALNLMTDGWDSSPHLASSPTGVLQRTTFRSLSNSSAGSSPRMENNHLGTNHISSSLPAL